MSEDSQPTVNNVFSHLKQYSLSLVGQMLDNI